MPPAQQGAQGAAPAKTMFGYAAPVIPQAGNAPAAGRPGAPAPAAPGHPQPGQPPQQVGYGQPPQQQANPYGQPQAANPYGQPQPQANPYGQPQQPAAANPYGQPQPQAANPYGQPQQPAAANPYGQPQAANPYGQPQQPAAANPYGQPQAANPYGQPQQPATANPYGQPQQPTANPYGQPQQPAAANTYGQAPPQQAYGQPPQQAYGQPAPQQNPYGQQGGYPPAQGLTPPQQDLPGPLDDLARRLPTSAAGTIFGFPVARLRDPSLQRTVLLMAGIALLATLVIPISLSPFKLGLSLGGWNGLIWPIISGGAYLLVAAAPPHIRAKVPPAVLQWIPFVISYIGIFGVGGGGGFMPIGGLYFMGYAVLVFGLLARIAQPADQTARIVIAVGAGMMVPGFLSILGHAFSFSTHGGFIFTIMYLLLLVVSAIGILCIAFVVPPAKLPPALQAIDSLAPVFAAVLLAWLPVMFILLGLGLLIHAHMGIMALLLMVHMLIRVVAYFGVLMMAAPAAYEEGMRMLGKGPPGGSPSQGGGYPPQGGGYPPQSGGYPPQGGGYPPQGGGGYPPQGGGGGYPPQGGGGYPPQGGGQQGGGQQGGGWQ